MRIRVNFSKAHKTLKVPVILTTPQKRIVTDFLIDTGSPFTIINYTDSIRLSIPHNKKAEIIRIGGRSFQSYLYDGLDIILKSEEKKEVQIKTSVRVLKPFSSKIREIEALDNFPNILGLDFLEKEKVFFCNISEKNVFLEFPNSKQDSENHLPPILKQGLTQVFWGNGKGKTTSALGTALRACGSGYKVHLVQFMKNGSGDHQIENPGEIKALEKFPSFSYKRFGAGSWIIGKPKQHHLDSAEEALLYLLSCFQKDYDIIIADEILYAVQLSLLPEDKVLQLIKAKPKNKELILTGSHKPLPKIFEHSDLITEVKKHKHPYDSGILARKGLEY